MKTDAFGARATLDTGFGRATIYRLDALEKAGVAPGLARLPFSIKVLLEAVLRNVDGELVTAEDVKNLGAWNAAAPEGRRAALHARARDPPGLHRRPRGRGPRLDARGGEAPRRRPEADQPARARRPRGRPLGAGGRLRLAGRPPAATPRSSSSATASATSSCAGARRPSRTSASCRPRPASSTR